jgi:hypothetical protein
MINLDGADGQALVRLSYVRSKEKREPVLITIV